jgi:hypothetical protein
LLAGYSKDLERLDGGEKVMGELVTNLTNFLLQKTHKSVAWCKKIIPIGKSNFLIKNSDLSFACHNTFFCKSMSFDQDFK